MLVVHLHIPYETVHLEVALPIHLKVQYLGEAESPPAGEARASESLRARPFPYLISYATVTGPELKAKRGSYLWSST